MAIERFSDGFVIDDVKLPDCIVESGDLAIGNPAFESRNPRIVNRQTVAQSTISQLTIASISHLERPYRLVATYEYGHRETHVEPLPQRLTPAV